MLQVRNKQAIIKIPELDPLQSCDYMCVLPPHAGVFDGL